MPNNVLPFFLTGADLAEFWPVQAYVQEQLGLKAMQLLAGAFVCVPSSEVHEHARLEWLPPGECVSGCGCGCGVSCLLGILTTGES